MAELTEEHHLIRNAAAKFADEVVAPRAAELDEREAFCEETYRALADNGFLGIGIAEVYGGVGADSLSYALVMEELSRGYSSIADQCGLVELVATLLERFGTADQKERYLRPLLRAHRKCAFAITESEAGSDVAGIRTFAEPVGAEWRLNGAKMWIHNGPICDFALVLARTDRGMGTRGMSIFVVDADAKGFSCGRKEKKMGQRASQLSSLHFDNIHLSDAALLGEQGMGFKQIMQCLDKGRIGIGALAVGITQAALDTSIEHAKQRKQFGRPIGDNQAIQWKLADMAKDIHAARLMVHHAARKYDTGERASPECAMAKCFAADAAVAHTSAAVQIHGGSGYVRGTLVERLYRDAKIAQIYEGTNEIQRMIIARSLLA